MNGDQYSKRVVAVGERLRQLAKDRPGLTTPDAKTGEQWNVGQTWGHISEFVPFWIEQIGDVIEDYRGEPIPFGRVPGETARGEAIAEGPQIPMERHLHWLDTHLTQLEEFVRSIPEEGWKAQGLFRNTTPMSLPEMLDQFLVGHLEEHADQLEAVNES